MVRKLFRQMAAVQSVSMAAGMINLLIDSFVIGRLLGPRALAAYGLANPVLIIYSAVGSMLVCGVQVACGKCVGYGDGDGMNACFSSAVAMALAFSGVVIPAVFAACDPLCSLLGASASAGDGTSFRMTGDYLKGYTLGMPFFLLYQIMVPCLQLLGKRRLMLRSVAVLTVVNAALDFLGVYALNAGMFGIGAATSLSYLAALVVPACWFLKKDCALRFSAKGVRRAPAADVLKAGSPMVVADICFTFRTYLCNLVLLGIAGETAVAAFSIVNTLTSLIFCVGLGTGSVALTLSSVFYGDRDRASLRELVRAMVPFALLLVSAAAVLTLVLAPWMADLFVGRDAEVFPAAVSGLRLITLSLLPAVVSNAFRNYLQGVRHTGAANLIAAARFLMPAVPLIWLFGRLFGMNGVWTGTVLNEVVTLLLIAAWAWRRQGKITLSPDAFLFLDPDPAAERETCLDLTVRDVPGAVAASEKISVFCLEQGLDRRSAMLFGLCAEEIACNIIAHGFTKDRKPHGIDVRLVLGPERKILRIRDNCARFDPVDYMEMHKGKDEAHIGLRLIMGVVKDASYLNSLGFNNLTLTL